MAMNDLCMFYREDPINSTNRTGDNLAQGPSIYGSHVLTVVCEIWHCISNEVIRLL